MVHKSVDDDFRKALLSELEYVRLRLGGEAAIVGSDMTDPGTMDWSGAATITVDAEADEEEGRTPWYQTDGSCLSVAKSEPQERELVILEASGLRINLEHIRHAFDALDARGEDYAHFVPIFGNDFRGPELADEIEDRLETGGTEVVIIDRVTLAPVWRGLGGVGRLFIARLLRWVCSEPRIVAVQPFPIELEMDQRKDNVVFDPAMERACHVWRSLGFGPFVDGIWYMDPGMAHHHNAVAALEGKLGLPD